MAKRVAGRELNHDNWDQEEDEEEAGSFHHASKEVIEKREIKKAKRRVPAEGNANSGTGVFKGFSFNTQSSSSKPFSFTSQQNATTGSGSSTALGSFKFTSTAVSPSAVTNVAASVSATLTAAKNSSPVGSSGTEMLKETESQYRQNLRSLNESVLRWIDDHVKKNPYCILTPVFSDYDKYIKELDRDFPNLCSGIAKKNPVSDPKNASVAATVAGFSFVPSAAPSNALVSSSVTESTKVPAVGAGFFSSSGKSGNSEAKGVDVAPAAVASIGTGFSFSTSVLSSSSLLASSSAAKDSKPGGLSAVPGFSFGVQPSKEATSSPASGFSFGVQPSKEATSSLASGFSFGVQPSKEATSALTSGFSFGVQPSKEAMPTPASGFSFGVQPSKNATVTSSTGFSFGTAAASSMKGPSTDFKFDSTPSTSGSGGKAKDDTAQQSEQKDGGGEDENYVPPKTEVVDIQEEDAFYTVRCKLYFKIDKDLKDRGIGNLYLKPCGDKTQLLVRAGTTLGNILLNIMLNKSIPSSRQGNKVMLMCIPNPPLKENDPSKTPIPVIIRVKTDEEAETLLKQISDHKL